MSILRPGRKRSTAMRVLALLAIAVIPATVAIATSTAAAEPTVDFDYDVQCRPNIGLYAPATRDDTNSKISYKQPWKSETPMQGQYMGTQHITNYGGATASFDVPTPPYVFALGFTMMRNAGKAAVYYNNQLVKVVDMYAPTSEYNCVLEMYGGVPAGTLMVKALNQKNPASGGTYVNVDYIHYET
jgi:hypothetical protein